MTPRLLPLVLLLTAACSSSEVLYGAPSASPTPTASCSPLEPDCADGKPGWSTGFTGCQDAEVDASAPRSQTLAPGVTVTLQSPPQAALDAAIPVKVVVRNETDRTVEVGISSGLSVGAGIGGPGGTSGQDFNDHGGQRATPIAAHSSYVAPFTASSQACGDTKQDGRTTLPAGDYTLTVNAGFALQGGGSVRVLSAPLRLG